jgi:DNA-binding response OmpR family regulator
LNIPEKAGVKGDDMRLLVVEDETKLAAIIKRGFEEEGYSVDVVYDGLSGLLITETTPYDLVVLDLTLPRKDGIEVCRELRNKNINVPILMLTARDSIEDRVRGLDSGADDYVVKPFAFSELLARVRALTRRESPSKNPKLKVGNLIMDTRKREVWRSDQKIDLTVKEYAILDYLMRHPDVVITRVMLEEAAWDYEYEGLSNIIDVYIRRLRKKIDEGDESIIQTIRGIGYRLHSE